MPLSPDFARLRPTTKGFVSAGLIVFGLALVPVALASPIAALAAAGLLSLVTLIAAAGTDRASQVLFVIAFGLAPLTSFSLGIRPFVLASAVFFLAFALAVPSLLNRTLRVPPAFIGGAVLFTGMGFLAALFAIDSWFSIGYLVTAVIALVAMPVMVAWMEPSDRLIYAAMVAFAIGTAASTLYGLPRDSYRNAGFTYHPVALAYTAMLTLSFVPFMWRYKARGRVLVVPLLAFLALIGVWTSGSRTGLVVLAALLLVVPLLERSLKLGVVIGAGVILVLPFLLGYDSTGRETSALSRLLGSGGAQGSDSVRMMTMQDGLDQVQANPVLGNGYSIEHTYVIHNIYLQVLAAEGVFGFLGLMLVLVSFVAYFRRATGLTRCLTYPGLAVILAGPFQPNMADHYLGLSLGLCLAAAVRVEWERIRKRRGETSPDQRPWAAAPAMLHR